jgi:hypothetical protein
MPARALKPKTRLLLMRRETIIVGLIGLNLVLAAVLAWVWSVRLKNSQAALPVATAAPAPAKSVALEPKSLPAARPDRTSAEFHWRALESPDYRQFIARLRGVACPEQTIQDIIIAKVNKDYAAREAALKLRPELTKPWEVNAWTGANLYEKQKQMRELLREKRALLKDLLGIDVPMEMPAVYGGRETARYEAAFAALPESKRDRVRDIQESFWDKAEALEQRTRGFWEPEDMAERKRLHEERRQALAQVLTSEELDSYELDTSSLAVSLRAQLSAFAPTDKELREIFKLRRQLEEQFEDDRPGADEVRAAQRVEAHEQAEQQIKATLGEERYAEYRRSQDYNFRNLARVAQQNGLSKELAVQAYELQKQARLQVAQVRANRALSWQQQQEALRSIQAETEKALVQALGEPAYRALQGQGGLRILYGPRFAPAATTPAPQ